MKSVIKFDRHYDVDCLCRDLETAEQEGKRHLHYGIYHDGGWSAIPLVSLAGDTGPTSLKFGQGTYEKTPILSRCPYFEEVIDSFQCPKERVRLMRLEPGKNILEHRDDDMPWALGKLARMHIPVVTHDDVYFYLDGRRIIMRPGELWYCDFSRPHSVANRSPVARVHLVMDLVMNPWLRAMFPSEPLSERIWNLAFRQFYGTGLASAPWLAKLRRWMRQRLKAA